MLVAHIKGLISLFRPLCSDHETLDALSEMASDRERWPGAHNLFARIRRKTLVAEREENSLLRAQYRFEETCAKALYNLSGHPAPFDADSPYWVVPSALVLAKRLGIEAQQVAEIVTESPRFSS